MLKVKLIKRLNWYYPLEQFHAIITFPSIIFSIIWYFPPIKERLFFIYGLLICTIILLQGQYYWKIKLNSLKLTLAENPKRFNFFKKSKIINQFLIFTIPFVFILQLYISHWIINSKYLLLWSVFVNIFAILEYINYYHFQLSIDNKADWQYLIRNKRFKVAHLAKDLKHEKIKYSS